MKLSREQVRHVATLARLELTQEEEERFSTQLSATLDYIQQLNELDTGGVGPTSHALDLTNVFRDDRQGHPFDAGVWKQNAPAQDHGHFRVPRIIED